MKKILLAIVFLAPLFVIGQGVKDEPSKGAKTASATVSDPLRPYRPWVRWWWNGDKVDTAELKRELGVLHEAGIGGVEINPIEFPSKRCDDMGIASLEWLSDEWLEALESTLREARRLDMGCDLLVGSGWPFGKESLPMEERAQVMLTYAEGIDLTQPYGTSKTALFKAVDPQVTVPNPDRKFTLVALYLAPDTITALSDILSLPIPESDSIVVMPDMLKGLTHGTFYALVHCVSFASVINGAPGASGPILDHMNQAAVWNYLEDMRKRLEGRLGPMKKWLRAYFVDSMELEGSNWTTDFAEEFRKRRGYDLMPWLPFTMFKVGRLGDVASYRYGSEFAPDFNTKVQQVRHDFELTKAELLDERYTQTFLKWCKEQGVKSRAQAYGRGFFPLESSLGYDIPEGESWTTNYLRHRVGYEMGDEDYRRGRAYTMIDKYVSSAAHLTGKRIVSAEEMTNTYMLFNTPLELLKVGSDMSAFSGITHSVWHGFNYNPPEAGFPGWVQYGSYLNEKNSWWPYFHLLNEYRARMSEKLQHAELQADIAIELPIDEMWGEIGVQTEPFPNYPKGSRYIVPQLLWEAVHKNGGNCDLITSRTRDLKKYKAYFRIGDSNIVLEYKGRKYELSQPDSNHYLEWYTEIQKQYGLPHAVTIERPDRFLLQNHYRTDDEEDMYLFVNAHLDSGIVTPIKFPKEVWRGRTAWAYNPNTGARQMLYLDNGQGILALNQSESGLIIFDRDSVQQYSKKSREYFRCRLSIDLLPTDTLSHWEAHFHNPITGWDTAVFFDTILPMNELPLKDFSGTITLRSTFNLEGGLLNMNKVFVPTRDICELRINGHDCGTVWFGEHWFSVAPEFVHSGENTVVIKLTTTLNNYAHTLTENGVVQHFVIKRNIPTSATGLIGPVLIY